MKITSINLNLLEKLNVYHKFENTNINFDTIHLKIPYENEIFEIQIRYKKLKGKIIYKVNILDPSNVLKSYTKEEIENI